MKIICAGLSKTGTKSLAAALRILGFSVHDFDEHPVYYGDEYIQAIEGEMPDFAAMYKNIDAVIDHPVYFFWKEIKQSCPSSKVILSERDDAETWVDSLLLTFSVAKKTIQAQRLWTRLGMAITPAGRKWTKLLLHRKTIFFANEADNESKKSKLAQLYLEHNASVKASVPRDQLLVYNVKQGWKPLCDFLGVDVPDVPFPRLNVKSAGIPAMINQSPSSERVFNELMLTLAVVVIIVAMFIFVLVRL